MNISEIPRFDVIIVGHLSIDVNVLPWGVIENMVGGAPTYAGFSLVALKKNSGIVSRVGTDFIERFPPIFSKFGLDTEGISITSEHTTTFENTYDEAGNRSQKCKHIAPKIRADGIPEAYKEARSFYVSPIVDEVPLEVLKLVKKENNIVMLDPQGLFRKIGKDGEVKIQARGNLGDFLDYVDIVKIGKEESKAFEGSPKEILEGLVKMGPKVAIMTQGEKGCTMLSDEGLREIESLKVEARDLTGAGDTFGAAFLANYLETRDAVGSAKFASAAAGLKVKYKGPIGFPSEEEILDNLNLLQ